jgi:hypothetical protein
MEEIYSNTRENSHDCTSDYHKICGVHASFSNFALEDAHVAELK